MSAPLPSTRPVVIFRLGSIGDTVVTLPCLHKVAASFPHSRRIVLTNQPVSANAAPVMSVLDGSGLVDASLSYPIGTRVPRQLWDLASRLRALGATTLIYLTEARGLAATYRDIAFFRLCGFRRIIGAPVTPDRQRCRIDADTGMVEPEARRLSRCIAALGPIDVSDPALWDLHLSDDEQRIGQDIVASFAGRPYLAINMGGKSPRQDWGEVNWRRLMAKLADDSGHLGLLIVGAAQDSARAHTVASGWPGPWIDACGRLPPRPTVAAFATARLFIGHESGPLQLAAASRCPWVGLFGNLFPPRRWHPQIGQGVALHRMEGVAAIAVEDVVDAVKRTLIRTES